MTSMTLNGQNALCCRKDASFGVHCSNLNEDRPILSAAKMWANDSIYSFWKYKVHADWEFVWPGHWGLSTTAIFGDLGGYVFENFRDIRQAILYDCSCRPVTECKMNNLEWPWVAIFMSKSVFGQHLNQSVWMSKNNTTSAIPRCSAHCMIS